MNNPQPSISLCMLTCNEALVLRRCLDLAKGAYDELIIVDTGSTDTTKEVAHSCGALIVDFPWIDDFAAARNAGVALATKDWVLILDPDETISPSDIPKIRALTTRPDVDAWQLPTRNYTNNAFLVKFVINPFDYSEGKGFRGYAESVKVRLFRNHIGLKFEGFIHEMVDYSVDRLRLRGLKSTIPIHHSHNEDPNAPTSKKAYFYLRLCEKKAELEPDNSAALWELGIAQYTMGSRRESIRNLARAVKLSPPTPERLFTLGAILASLGYLEKGRLLIEKGVCLQFPGLTHIQEELKAFPEEAVDE